MDTLSIIDIPILPWAIGLAVGFPLLMVALGELAFRARRHQWSVAPVLGGVRTLVVPTLALSLFMRHVMGLPADDTMVQVVKTVLWIAVLHQVLSFVNEVIFGSAPEGSWQAKVPSLVRDLTRFALVAVGAAVIYSEVWGKEIGAAWAALGLGSVVIGLALQEPLGNTVSGLILLAERPLAVGDWITAEGVSGQVVEINWRSVRMLTSDLELKIIPSSALYRASFSNLSRPTPERWGSVDIRLSSGLPPYRIKAAMLEMMATVPHILPQPSPTVRIVEYQGDGIVYRLGFNVAQQEDLGEVRDTVLSRAWYLAQRERFAIPGQPPSDSQGRQALDVLREFPLFSAGIADLDAMAGGLKLLGFGAGEVIVRESGPLMGLYLVVAGEAELSARDRSGLAHTLGRVRRGDFIGENALVAGHPSEVTVTALDDTEVLIIEPSELQRMMEQSPRLVQAIGQVLESRRSALHSLRSIKRPASSQAADAA
jgi:small-conductance mechanosensitive channel